jgi:hypothetical protein
MLSALVQRLYNIRGEKYISRKKTIIDLCSSAYPDVRPWQVKKYCIVLPRQNNAADATEMESLYYTYLSLLLHPIDGNEAARRDPRLVAVSKTGALIMLFNSSCVILTFFTNRNGAKCLS